jgi:hypothetical protein
MTQLPEPAVRLAAAAAFVISAVAAGTAAGFALRIDPAEAQSPANTQPYCSDDAACPGLPASASPQLDN